MLLEKFSSKGAITFGRSKKMSKEIKTTREDICNYWFSRIEESEFSVDASEALERCWRCGSKRNLERCHIISRSLGGEDVPSNYVLLCKRCHLENPNVEDPEIIWDWLKAYKENYYDTFWINRALEEYTRIYKTKFQDDIAPFYQYLTAKEAKEFFEKEMDNCATHHFGQAYLNSATIAGLMRILIKKLRVKYK